MERLRNCGGSLTIPCQGSLIVPSGNIDTLSLVNEFTLDPRRLTTAQSPLGGVNGLISYSPGSVHVTEGDGIYLTDVAGNNTSKDLPTGLLSRLGYLTVDTVAHTITEEFVVSNTATSNNPTVIDGCDSTAGWEVVDGAGTLSIEAGRLKVVGTSNVVGLFTMQKTFSTNFNTYPFLELSIESSLTSSLFLQITTDGWVKYKIWEGWRFAISQNVNTSFVLPVLAPLGTTGQNPNTSFNSPDMGTTVAIKVGIACTPSSAFTLYIDNFTADVGKSAYIEIATPDNLAASPAYRGDRATVMFFCWNGSNYLNIQNEGAQSNYFLLGDRIYYLDGTSLQHAFGNADVYQSPAAVYNPGSSTETVAAATVYQTIVSNYFTYSANRGTRKRIGFSICLPPSDGGRTAFNQCRFKVITYYTDLNKTSNILPDLSGNGNNGTMSGVGLTTDNLGNPYGAMSFDGIRSSVDCGTKSAYNITDELTIFAKVKTPNVSLPDMDFISKNSFEGWRIAFNSGKITATVKTSNYNDIHFNSAQNNTWYEVVVTFTKNNLITLYINGTSVSSFAPASGDIATNANNLYIGLRQASPLFFNGDVEYAGIASRAWTLGEVISGIVPLSGLVAQWKPSTVSHMGQSTQEFSNDNNASTGLLNIAKPWLAIIDPITKKLEYYIFTERPTSFSYKRDETGNVYEVVVNPGNGLVYKGSTVWANNTLDTKNDVLLDISGNGNNGVMSNVVLTADNLGNPGGAMSFGGVSSYVDCGTGINLTSAITIALRIKRSRLNTSEIFTGKGNLASVSSPWFAQFSADNAIYFITGNGTTNYTSVSTTTITDTNWHDLIFTFDGNHQINYIDGSSLNAGAVDWSGSLANSPSFGMSIGKGGTYGSSFFSGLIADYRVYSRALSSAEVADYHNNQPVSSTGLVVQWQPSSDSKPDMLDATIQNSIAQMLSVYKFNQ